jgi:glutamyl-tRNA reductase
VKILLIGLSHKTAPLEVRERLAFTPATLRSALTHFDATHSQAHLEDVREGIILSTCNRLEVYTIVRDPEVATAAILSFLSRSCDLAQDKLSNHLYTYQDEEAVQHLLRVASGLDSMVLGEPQILGQVTEAYQAALAQGAAGTVLSALFRAAIHTGKRARTETAISVNSVSVSSVAAKLAQRLLGELSERQALLIGAGEMAAIAVRALLKRGVSKIVVANRTYEKSVELARVWGGKAINFQQLPAALAAADIVITSTSAPHPILDKEILLPVIATRGQRPLFIIDIAVPRDVEPDVSEISTVHLVDIDGLQGQADQHASEREAEIPRVENIVTEEVAEFMDWFSSLEATSTITALRQMADQLRQTELARAFNRLDLDEREQKVIATMSHRLINKILHEPTMCLKQEAAHGNGAAYISTLRQLFALEQATAKPGQSREEIA